MTGLLQRVKSLGETAEVRRQKWSRSSLLSLLNRTEPTAAHMPWWELLGAKLEIYECLTKLKSHERLNGLGV